MFSFREFYFRLYGLFNWEYTRTQFLLSVSRNQYDITLAGYRNGKSATDPALILNIIINISFPHIFGGLFLSVLFGSLLSTIVHLLLEKMEAKICALHCFL